MGVWVCTSCGARVGIQGGSRGDPRGIRVVLGGSWFGKCHEGGGSSETITLFIILKRGIRRKAEVMQMARGGDGGKSSSRILQWPLG